MPSSWEERRGRAFRPSSDRWEAASTSSLAVRRAPRTLECELTLRRAIECCCKKTRADHSRFVSHCQYRDPESEDVRVFASVEEALTHLAAPGAGQSIGRIFVIGGAQLYTVLLNLDSGLATVDKLLVTRVLAPQYDCDAYFPEFRTEAQYKAEVERASKIIAQPSGSSGASASEERPANLLKQEEWSQASTDSLRQYLGDSCPSALAESSDMVTSEGETWYQYQMWERKN